MDLMALFSGNAGANYLIEKLLIIPGLVLFFSFRGFFQAWVARKLGDETPANMGFLTMNPLAHIHPIGFVCLLLVGFGFGKPIQFNSRYYKNPKRDGAIQILSAPLAGLILAFVMSFIMYVLILIGTQQGILLNKTFVVLFTIFQEAFSLSVCLTVFLFIPLPGFDGYRLIANFLPYKHYRKLYAIEKYSLFIFLGFIILLEVPAVANVLIYAPANFLANIIAKPWELLFGLFV